MAKNIVTGKAVRSEFVLGGVTLDGYQLPDGSYRMAKGQVCDAANLDRKRLSELQEKKGLKSLIGAGSSLSEKVLSKHAVEGVNTKVDLLPLEMVAIVWSECGTTEGKALGLACMVESLERRLDQAFEVQRSEQERNDRFAERVIHADGWRKLYTDWQKKDGCIGADYGRRVNELKRQAGMRIVPIDEYSAKEVQRLTHSEVVYNAMRNRGMSHKEALECVPCN